VCVFINAVPISKLFVWVTLESWGGIVEDMCYERRRAETCVDLLVCPSRTGQHGGQGDCVKEGGGKEGERTRERALGLLL
jgi:hypothetical protein